MVAVIWSVVSRAWVRTLGLKDSFVEPRDAGGESTVTFPVRRLQKALVSVFSSGENELNSKNSQKTFRHFILF